MASKDEFNQNFYYISRKVKKNPIPGSPSKLKNRSLKKFEQTLSKELTIKEDGNEHKKKIDNDVRQNIDEEISKNNQDKKEVDSPDPKYKSFMDSRR